MDETEEKFKKFELDDAKLINEMKIQNAKRKKFTAQLKILRMQFREKTKDNKII